VQIALAFYFVNLQDFQIQTDLTIARDKVLGVLLGILVMGFIFDRLGTKSDAEQLQKLLVRNVRMLAQLGVCPVAREWMPRALRFSFATGARKTLPSGSGFRGLSQRCVPSTCWNSVFSPTAGGGRRIPNWPSIKIKRWTIL
jgi:hypothetical protein